MIQRRQFLVGGATLAAVSMLAGAAPRPARAQPKILALFDGRTVDGRSFAGLARQHGLTAHDTGRDVASLLYGDMRDWYRGPETIIVGVGRHTDFMVASGLAREKGLSSVIAVEKTTDLKRGEGTRFIAGSPDDLTRPFERAGVEQELFANAASRLTGQNNVVWLLARTRDLPGRI